jgi:hypothetical protein
MLDRLKPRTCVECGRAVGDPGFSYQAGQIQRGPAYWSDEGLLCSQVCALTHHKRRAEEGRPMTAPAPDPFGRR